ncbi:MAG: hypothetical protein PUH36_08600 [Subdoligranulum sp.]|nr:hypothetical protein [Subdoligranulum sp.]
MGFETLPVGQHFYYTRKKQKRHRFFEIFMLLQAAQKKNRFFKRKTVQKTMGFVIIRIYWKIWPAGSQPCPLKKARE